MRQHLYTWVLSVRPSVRHHLVIFYGSSIVMIFLNILGHSRTFQDIQEHSKNILEHSETKHYRIFQNILQLVIVFQNLMSLEYFRTFKNILEHARTTNIHYREGTSVKPPSLNFYDQNILEHSRTCQHILDHSRTFKNIKVLSSHLKDFQSCLLMLQ